MVFMVKIPQWKTEVCLGCLSLAANGVQSVKSQRLRRRETKTELLGIQTLLTVLKSVRGAYSHRTSLTA